MKLSENQLKNLIGQILYDCGEMGILNEQGVNISHQLGKLSDLPNNGLKHLSETIIGFIEDVENDSQAYQNFHE